MTEITQTQETPAVAKPAKKKGANVEVSFTNTPEGRIMRARVRHSGNLYELNINDLLASHPSVAQAILDMGIKTLVQNQINTTIAAPGNTPDDGEASMAARIAAWKEGRYTSGVRTGGIPMFLLAFERALTKLGKSPDEVSLRVAKVLAEYRLDGDALSPDLCALRAQIDSFDEDDEEQAKAALKLFRKHQAGIRAKFLGNATTKGNPLVLAAMDELQAERVANKPETSIDSL
jgi:hypothetical protein